MSDTIENKAVKLSDLTSVTQLIKDYTDEKDTNKVDKIEGKSLLDDTEIERLKGVNNYDDTEVKENIAEVKTDVTKLSSQIDEIENNGVKVETVQNTVKELAESGEIQAYTIANKSLNASEKIENGTINEELLSEDIKLGVDGIYEDDNKSFYITDNAGNVIVKIDKNGLEVAGIGNITELRNDVIENIINRNEDSFYITDNAGNVIVKIDKNGLEAVGINKFLINPYHGKKFISIGDSMSEQAYISDRNTIWQHYLADLTGMIYDDNETKGGKDGHSAMAVGGTAILPTVQDSIYLRALDAKYYNPDVIFVYAGQNDRIYPSSSNGEEDGIIDDKILGTINDTPLKVTEIISYMPTFYARYMGMIENLLEDNPNALICLITLMKCRITVDGDTITEEIRNNIDKVRFTKVKAVREIAEKYSLPLVDLWENSGLNYINNANFYREDGSVQVHQNSNGNMRIVECICRTLI